MIKKKRRASGVRKTDAGQKTKHSRKAKSKRSDLGMIADAIMFPEKTKAKPAKLDVKRAERDRRVVRGEVLPPAKRCECGKVELTAEQQPLEMCESCTGCDQTMHTFQDLEQHKACLAPKAAPQPVDADLDEPRKAVKEPRRKAAQAPTVVTEEVVERWPFFFQCQRYPVLRSQIVTSLMAGKRLIVDRLPNYILLDVVLLATACREFHESEIVDEYDELLRRTEEEWRKPDWTAKVFSSIHCNWADAIINRGIRDFESPETRYIPAFAGWFLEHDPVEYFSEELKEDVHTAAAKVLKVPRSRAKAVMSGLLQGGSTRRRKP